MDGEDINGTWVFTITDNAATDNGTLQNVTLNLGYNPLVCGTAAFFDAGGAATFSDANGNGNNNGFMEPGETTLEITIPVTNIAQDATGRHRHPDLADSGRIGPPGDPQLSEHRSLGDPVEHDAVHGRDRPRLPLRRQLQPRAFYRFERRRQRHLARLHLHHGYFRCIDG
jgi:hypothetical protein